MCHILGMHRSTAVAFLPLLLLQCHMTPAKQLIRLGYFTEGQPFAVACARGWFDTVEVEVGCFPQSSGGYAVSKLDQADLDVAHLGSTPIAVSNSRGVLVDTFQMGHGMDRSQGLAVRTSSGPRELLGKRVACPFGSTAHYHMLYTLHMLELPLCAPGRPATTCVTVVNMSPTALMAAWDDGTIHGGFCWGKAFVHMRSNGGVVIVDSQDLKQWGKETFIVMAARRNFTTDYPGVLEHISRVKLLLDESWLANDVAWGLSAAGNESYLASVGHALSPFRPRRLPETLNERAVVHGYITEREFLSTATQLGCSYIGHSSSCSTATM